MLDNTPFYGEMGGQVGDKGVLVSENETIDIIDTKRENGQSIHIVKALPKNIEADFMACVDTDKRNASAANHTATHLLDYALKQVLGDHVEQKGSFVSDDTLRFDFSHFQKMTAEEIREVERKVNDMIRQDFCLDEHRDIPIDEAKKLGAIALFGEKYGDRVRVVQFGPSVEFCGGIHASSTGHIGMFKIISESSVASGIRRIEAKTGKECEQLLYDLEDSIIAIKSLFNNAKDLKGVIAKYIEDCYDEEIDLIYNTLISGIEFVEKDVADYVCRKKGMKRVVDQIGNISLSQTTMKVTHQDGIDTYERDTFKGMDEYDVRKFLKEQRFTPDSIREIVSYMEIKEWL